MARDILIETKDGDLVRLRPMVPGDEDALRHAISQLSSHSRYLRFFNGAATLPDHVVRRLSDVDGTKHIAWAAIDENKENKPIIGAVHAQRSSQDEKRGDFSIGLLDAWHSKGLARLLIALLSAESSKAGFEELIADVLWENKKGRALMGAIGAKSMGSDGSTIQFRMVLDEVLAKLGDKHLSPAMDKVLAAIEDGDFFESAA
ncbi:N-acetyltransferase [Henriciella barbarensis]|uniref:N-acetyltransferase n=1 Tax=Henriciella barbarensis TaxID=86342 RepID=A0A399QYF3_9PROT|nr:GNAT family N-acetyltransferase [Henriciella barbarensis]RIJ23551.1 N-acetyltransferase [Henriciella barbarensis]